MAGWLFRPESHLCALLVVAFFAGGGGVGAALFNLVVQLTALLVLALNYTAVARFVREAPRGLVFLVACTLALPLLQLVPLPPAMWMPLPGRDLVAQSLGLVAAQHDWMPLSLAPARTFVAFLGLLPPLAVLVLGWSLPAPGRRMVLVLLIALGACSVLLGAVQLMSGGRLGVIQSEGYGSNNVHGVFANRNSAGLFFVIALVALVAWTFAMPRRRPVLAGAAAAAVLMVLCLVLTRSRSSMALSLFVLPVLGYALTRIGRFTRRRAVLLSGAILGVGVLGIAGLGALGNSNVRSSVERFASIQDIRPIIWEDTVVAIRRYGVVGSGMGTFDEVFQVDESLEYLDPRRAGRAHNDWLEIVLEAGVAGAILAAAWSIFILAAGARALRERVPTDGIAALAILAVFAFQSIIDYPLRNETNLCIAALAVGLLLAARARPDGEDPRGSARRERAYGSRTGRR